MSAQNEHEDFTCNPMLYVLKKTKNKIEGLSSISSGMG